jgi:phosphate starvation-inducible membrane PsiE
MLLVLYRFFVFLLLLPLCLKLLKSKRHFTLKFDSEVRVPSVCYFYWLALIADSETVLSVKFSAFYTTSLK